MFRTNRAQALSEIGRMQRTIERLAFVPRRAAQIAAPEITKLLASYFADGRDPYGRSWKPLSPATLAKHGPPPLTHTRTLSSGTKAVAMRAHYAGIALKVGAKYGYFHIVGFRNGKRKVPARPFFPTRGMPRQWSVILKSSCLAAVKEASR